MSTTDTLSGQTVAADAEILLAQPRGFCAGVDRAIEIVERAIAMHGAPIYVRHEIVHNKYVVEDLKKKGAIFVEELEEVPAGNVIFSAHGVSKPRDRPTCAGCAFTTQPARSSRGARRSGEDAWTASTSS